MIPCRSKRGETNQEELLAADVEQEPWRSQQRLSQRSSGLQWLTNV